jgi:hypothetical protein
MDTLPIEFVRRETGNIAPKLGGVGVQGDVQSRPVGLQAGAQRTKPSLHIAVLTRDDMFQLT